MPGVPWSPSVEVCEQEDQVRVCIDVPGVDESNLQVQIEQGTLTVRGERHDERAGEPGNRRSEMHYGSFVRRSACPRVSMRIPRRQCCGTACWKSAYRCTGGSRGAYPFSTCPAERFSVFRRARGAAVIGSGQLLS